MSCPSGLLGNCEKLPKFSLAAALALALAACSTAQPQAAPPPALKPHPNSIAADLAATWEHIPNHVSNQQFEQDKAGCLAFASLAPDGAGTPGLRGQVAFLNCLRAKGYQPVRPQ